MSYQPFGPNTYKKLIIPTTEFVVNGTSIPDVDFDVGTSFAGSLPVGAANNDSSMFFWFFPTSAENTPKEIVIWLNGGVSGFFSLVPILLSLGHLLLTTKKRVKAWLFIA